MTGPHILVAESHRFSTAAANLLRSVGTLRLANLNRAGLMREVGAADVLWVRLRNRLDADMLRMAPRLSAVVSPTTGLNHIDLDQAAQKGVKIISLRGETVFLDNIRATAEHTLGLMLSLLRHLPQAHEHARAGGWNRDLFQGVELYQRTIGLVGYGRLGRIVGKYLRAFGAKVLVTDPVIHHDRAKERVQSLDLDTLLGESSMVSLHVNLTTETQGFFGKAQFDRMRKNSFFVNTARGELVDEAALLEALETGHLAGAAVDVISNERHPETISHHPVLRYARTHSNLLVTPHIGGCTTESMEKTERFMARKLCQWISQEWSNVVRTRE